MNGFTSLKFDNAFLRDLPVDTGPAHQSRAVLAANSTRVPPTRVSKPEMLIWSPEAAALLDLTAEDMNSPQAAAIFTGNELAPGMDPFATRYGGHQFGHWAGQLGDGRAISLGEVVNRKGERWEIQLKGAGPTPYSRNADGRAVLRSSLREFICSEAMFHLGVPTTRALSCVLTGDGVIRDMFYDGHPAREPGAITTRLAPSFLRFGHFEILAAQGETRLLQQLIDFTLRTHFPQIRAQGDEAIVELFNEVCARTAHLMAHWQRVGFVHGVMNTDNMSVLGLTIDYGPYGWLDVYDPDWTPNTTDAENRRYRFGQQPIIALWNLHRWAMALATVMKTPQVLEQGLQLYQETFAAAYIEMRLAKLGLTPKDSALDQKLIAHLDEALVATEVDMTIFYRKLAELHALPADTLDATTILVHLNAALYDEKPSEEARLQLTDWVQNYLRAAREDGLTAEERSARMNRVNPYFIPRNYLVQQAIDQIGEGNDRLLRDLMTALKTPYEENAQTRLFFARRPEWARHKAGCSALSCSS